LTPLPPPRVPPQAWDLYYHVFKRINKQLHGMTQLELQYAAPALVSRAASSQGRGLGSACRHQAAVCGLNLVLCQPLSRLFTI